MATEIDLRSWTKGKLADGLPFFVSRPLFLHCYDLRDCGVSQVRETLDVPEDWLIAYLPETPDGALFKIERSNDTSRDPDHED
jgi:hypothetical protein